MNWSNTAGAWVLAGLLLVIITPLALGGFWTQKNWGISDWDYYFSLHENWRQEILQYHVFPFWNPYTCGGTAGLGDPEFSVLTPTFLLEFIFGVPAGLRLAILLATAVGAVGMLLLGKRLGLSVWAAFLAALVFAFGSVNLLEIVEGHVNIFAAMWIPYIFWSWLGAYRVKHEARSTKFETNSKSKRFKLFEFRNWSLFRISDFGFRILPCALFLALTFYQGGIYLLFYTILALLALIILLPNKKAALLVTIQAGLISLGLAAFKLIPTLLWLKQFPDVAYASSAATLPWLHKILLGRYLHDAVVFPGQDEGWHEYGAYIGLVILTLALGSLIKLRQRKTWILWAGALGALLVSTSGPLLKPIFDQIPFIPRSNISRIILLAVIPLALLAGQGLDIFRRKLPRGWAVAASVIIILLAGADLLTLAQALSRQAFIVPPVEVLPSPAPWPIAFTPDTYQVRVGDVDYTRAYAATLAGYGTMNYCSVLGPAPLARTIYDRGDVGPVLIKGEDNQRELLAWSPNGIQVRVTAVAPTEVVLNTNFAKGWQVNGLPAQNIDGRVGTLVSAGTRELTFSYHAPGWLTGLFITLATVLGAAAYGIRYAMSAART